jgi:hypothetical protein
MTPEDIGKLKALAEKATKGPWDTMVIHWPGHPNRICVRHEQGPAISSNPNDHAVCYLHPGDADIANAAYIAAAHPGIVLELIAERHMLIERWETLRNGLSEVHPDRHPEYKSALKDIAKEMFSMEREK